MRVMQLQRIALFSLGVVMCVVVAMPSAAIAQSGAPAPAPVVRPPAPSKEEDPSYVMQLLVLVGIGAAAIGANLIPSKRGHQD